MFQFVLNSIQKFHIYYGIETASVYQKQMSVIVALN